MKKLTTNFSLRIHILTLVLGMTIICFVILKNKEKKSTTDKPNHLVMYTTPQRFFLNGFALQKYIFDAFHFADTNAAFKVMHHYTFSRGHVYSSTGKRWRYIAAKLGHPAAIREWRRSGRQCRDIFAFDFVDENCKAMEMAEYKNYIQYMAALIRADDAEAAVHLKRLRELGVTEKLLENPLALPGMEDEP